MFAQETRKKSQRDSMASKPVNSVHASAAFFAQVSGGRMAEVLRLAKTCTMLLA
jgi:hypothetical protein